MVREMHRDMNHLSDTIKELRLEQYLHKIMDVLQEEMNDGRLKTVPLPFVFYTFYSALTVPFLTKNLSASFFLEKDDSFEDILVQWKPYIVRQMETLLVVSWRKLISIQVIICRESSLSLFSDSGS